MLSNPDFAKPFYLATDASKYGLGAVLYQKGKTESKKEYKYIKFVSRALSGSEIHYGATKRELFAIVFAIEKLKEYLWGVKFVVETDHNALTYMFTQKKVNSTIANWLETILEYDFTVVHCPGIQHVLPDALSRFYDEDDPNVLRQDQAFSMLSEKATDISSMEDEHRDLEVVPDYESRKSLVNRAHLMGHFGARAMSAAIKNDGYTWKGIRDDCQLEVSKCLMCQRFNVGRHGYHPLKNLKALMPFDHVSIDLKEMPTSNRGNRYYLLLIDVATRYVILRPLAAKDMCSVASTLFNVFCDMGFPLTISMDNGAEFVNSVMERIVEISRMDRRLFTPYHHRGNGIAERAIKTTSDGIYKQLQGRDQDWDLFLPSMQLFYNLKVAELTGSTPYSLMFARSANKFTESGSSNLVVDVQELKRRLDLMTEVVYPAIKTKSDIAHRKRNQIFEKNHQILYTDIADGALVMVRDEKRSSKSEPRYEGPFTVVRRNKGGVYILRGRDGSEYTRPGHVLKLVHPEILDAATAADSPESKIGVVEKILNHRMKKGFKEHEYLVKWKDVPAVYNEWVFHRDFHDHGPIRSYWKQKQKAARQLDDESNRRVRFAISETEEVDNHSENSVLTAEAVDDCNGTRGRDNDRVLLSPDDPSVPVVLQSDLGPHWSIPRETKRAKNTGINYRE